ncbi:hypothetical protein [Pseudonocardia sp. TRM90224]|uniref:hypothetical protein n=1 Tax=Pseudonocardia sp. TRM90224 TaxID=2812678 RepID=UPI001E626E71|nr:hypothetical protein [Pseudonocardia sp. TRM90224]
MRARGKPWRLIADALREQFGLNARAAIRLAHGWSQSEVAQRWTAEWPDDPKTFKNISYWETWPSTTGYAPSLAVLERLAFLYRCSVADMLVDWGDHRGRDVESTHPAQEPIAWQVEHLALPELTRSIECWSSQLPEAERHWLLLKLSTATAAAAHLSARGGGNSTITSGRNDLDRLCGRWRSVYRFRSTSRNAELEGVHELSFRTAQGQLIGHSQPNTSGSILEMALRVDGLAVTGSWEERTSPTGHYRAATYRGSVEFVLDPTGRSMTGQWLGLGKHFVVNSGPWELSWIGDADPDTAHP